MPMPLPGQPPAPQGAPPPGAAPAHAGPGTMPSGNQGNSAKAMLDIRNAVKMLEQALPMIPMGSPLHEKVHKTALDLSKELTQGEENPALQMQQLVQMMRQASQQQPVNALSKLAAPPPNAPPAVAGGEQPQPGA